jgi:lipid II:glycine glycyltransferase (peptidoglycan interpeptide bridge formation enzyme)
MGGPIAENGIELEEADAVFKHLADQGGMRTSFRPNPLSADIWSLVVPAGSVAVPHLTHILDLSGGFEKVWTKRFKSATRNKIRKAEKSGLKVECDTTGRSITEFYDLYMGWIERRARERNMPLWLARWLGRWREPYKKFNLVSDAFGEACRVYVAWFDGTPVAASILLIFQEQAFYWRNASDRELTRKTRANDLLQRLMIEDACLAGCRYYHMGESGGVESLMHFKRRFGGQEYHYTEYSLEKIALSKVQQQLQGAVGMLENILIRRNRKQ